MGKKKLTRKKRIKQKEKISVRKQLVLGSLLFFGIALILVGVWYGTRIDSLQIKNVEVLGGFTISQSDIKDLVDNTLSGTYLKLVPKQFLWLYPKKEISENILMLDKVKNVYVEIVDKNTVTVAFEEYKPYALWCDSIKSSECNYIDAQGFSFSVAPTLTGSAFVRYVINDDKSEVGQTPFDKNFIEQTESFIRMMEESLSLFVTHVHKLGDYDVDYYISGGGVIKISQEIPMRESFDNLKTILTSEDFSQIEPGSFAYIDLRFGDKIFVNEVIESPEIYATSSTSSNPL